MTLLFTLACTLACTPDATPAPVPSPAQVTAPMSEAMRHARALSNRTPASTADRAVAWLLAHPKEAHGVLLEVLAERGPEAERILKVLPRMGQAEAVDVVAAVLRSDDELLAFPAARCLAQHPDPRAVGALVESLGGALHTRIAAIDGLAIRGDVSTCEAVAALLVDTDPNVRHHAARAAHALGCLGAERLAALATDPSEEVRKLAAELAP